MPYRQIIDINYAESTEPSSSGSFSSAKAGLQSEVFEAQNEEKTVWRVTRIWDSTDSALAFKEASATLRANATPVRTVAFVSGEEID